MTDEQEPRPTPTREEYGEKALSEDRGITVLPVQAGPVDAADHLDGPPPSQPSEPVNSAPVAPPADGDE